MSENEFFPLNNKILVKQLPREEKTAAGLYKAPNAEEPEKGIVVKVGRGVPLINEHGAFAIIPLECAIGDTVMFPPNVGVDMEVNGEKLLLLTEDYILLRSPAK